LTPMGTAMSLQNVSHPAFNMGMSEQRSRGLAPGFARGLVRYETVGDDYLVRRRLKRSAG